MKGSHEISPWKNEVFITRLPEYISLDHRKSKKSVNE